MWEQVKQAIVDSARELCGSVSMGGWIESKECMVKAAVERKEALGARDDGAKDTYGDIQRRKEKAEKVYIRAKRS